MQIGIGHAHAAPDAPLVRHVVAHVCNARVHRARVELEHVGFCAPPSEEHTESGPLGYMGWVAGAPPSAGQPSRWTPVNHQAGHEASCTLMRIRASNCP